MCEYCQNLEYDKSKPAPKALKHDSNGFFLLARSVYDKNLMVAQAYTNVANIFGRVKSTIHLFDATIHYCPMCGRCLDDDIKGTTSD